MSNPFSRTMAELWPEFDPIINRLSQKELLWLILFVNAYHSGTKEAMDIMCPDGSNMREEIIFMTHAERRSTPNEKRSRKLRFSYTPSDYGQDSISPEDAYLEALDNNLSFAEFN